MARPASKTSTAARSISARGAQARSRWSPASRACTRRQPHHDAGARRLGYSRGGARRGARSADRCDIYTDVDGVYTTDPRIVPKARRLDKIAYEEMLEMASLGAKVLQIRSVELAMVHRVRIFVRSSFDGPEDIDPHGNAARHPHLRRGGDRGTTGRHRDRLLQGRGADLDAPGRRTSRASPRRSSGRWRTPTSTST